MRVALITPVSMMSWQRHTNMQLVLPHLKYPEYWDNIRRHEARGDYMILDNGAAEGVQSTPEELVKLATQYKIDEVAIPDTLGDRESTIKQYYEFLNHADVHLARNAHHLKYGYVAQGESADDAFEGVEEIASYHDGDTRYVDVIYIPRLLVGTEDHLYERIKLAKMIHHEWPTLPIHFFGASKLWPREVMAVANEAGFVRSIDTSMPANYTIAREELGDQEEVGRIEDFFEWEPDTRINPWIRTQELMQRNMDTYLRWARYDG